MKCCYFCGSAEKIVPQKRSLWNGIMAEQCVICFKNLEGGLKIAGERGFYDSSLSLSSRLSVSSRKPTTSSGGTGNGRRYDTMKVSKDATGGDFLKASYVKEHRIPELLIVSDAQIATFEKDGKKTEKLQFRIQYEGYQENKEMPDTWTLNSKSKNALIDAWGEDTDDWKGKPIPITLSGDGEYRHITVDTLRIK